MTWGKETVAFLEVDQPFCTRRWGSSPCQAHLAAKDAVRKCYNTRSTCGDPLNYEQDSYLVLPGTAGNYVSTPDSVPASIVGDLDLRAKLAATDWTPSAISTLLNKWTTSGNQRSYMLQLLTDGKLRLSWSNNGTAVISKDSTAATGATDGSQLYVRATLDVNNGAAGNDVKFYTSSDGANWTQLGTTVTTGGTTSVFDSTAPLIIGGNDGGATERLTANVYFAEVRSGLDGPVAAQFDPKRVVDITDLVTTGLTGETWTINQSGGTPARLVLGFIRLRFARQQDGVLNYGFVLPSMVNLRTTPGAVNLGGLNKNMAALGQREVVLADFEDHRYSDLVVDPYRLERVTGVAAQKYLSLPGSSGNYASTPDAAANSITGDIDLRVRASANDWTPSGNQTFIAKRASAGAGQRSYQLKVDSGGTLTLVWSQDGTAELTATSTAATIIQDGQDKWVRATLDVDNGAAGRDVKFYTSADYDPGSNTGTWTQLGATVTQGGVTSIFDSTSVLEVGSSTGGTAELLAGKVYYVEVRSGLNGTVAARFDPQSCADGATSFVASTGETWTVNTSGSPAARITAVDKFDPTTRGTFWGKWAARNQYFSSFPGRVREGYFGDALSAMRTRSYVCDRIDGPANGKTTLTLKDLFSKIEARKSVAPVPSKGELAADMTGSPATFTLSPAGIGNSEYPTSGHVAIGDEVIQFTRSADVMTVVARAALNTLQGDHKQEDLVQLVLSYVTQRGHDIVYSLLSNFTEINPAALPKYDWDIEAAPLTELYTGRICKPTPVIELIGELAAQIGFTMWPDVFTGLVKFVALRPQDVTQLVNDDAWIVDDSLQVKRQDQRRVSQVWVYYGQRNPMLDLEDARNFFSRIVVADLEAEGPVEYGVAAIKDIFSRWVPQFGRTLATNIGNRIITMFRNPIVEAKFKVHESRAGKLELARYFYLQTSEVQDVTGQAEQAAHAATSIEYDEDELTIASQEIFFATPVAQGSETVIYLENDSYNLNLRTIYDSLYSAPIGTEIVRFKHLDGVILASTSVGSPAVRTGDWPAGVQLYYDAASTARVQGKGGQGSKGGNYNENGFNGEAGGDAFLAEYPITIDNLGKFWSGGGGAGSGGGITEGFVKAAGGGAGGGGAGKDVGAGAAGGTTPLIGFDGAGSAAGSLDAGGAGGAGSVTATGSRRAGNGGAGGAPGVAGGNGEDAQSDSWFFKGVGGVGAAAGRYIVGNALVTWVNTGDRRGGVA